MNAEQYLNEERKFKMGIDLRKNIVLSKLSLKFD